MLIKSLWSIATISLVVSSVIEEAVVFALFHNLFYFLGKVMCIVLAELSYRLAVCQDLQLVSASLWFPLRSFFNSSFVCCLLDKKPAAQCGGSTLNVPVPSRPKMP
ncbi:hypothetical protein M8J77_016460 [Diaphorina citri]|nr:hypothetical protein M8J77_016460 [Diaphorina citri]